MIVNVARAAQRARHEMRRARAPCLARHRLRAYADSAYDDVCLTLIRCQRDMRHVLIGAAPLSKRCALIVDAATVCPPFYADIACSDSGARDVDI